MRLAPIPICFKDDLSKAIKAARHQSKTTHNGKEAADCCELMTYLIVNLIKHQDTEGLGLPILLASQDESAKCSVVRVGGLECKYENIKKNEKAKNTDKTMVLQPTW